MLISVINFSQLLVRNRSERGRVMGWQGGGQVKKPAEKEEGGKYRGRGEKR